MDVSVRSYLPSGLMGSFAAKLLATAAYVFNDPKWMHEAIEPARFFGGTGDLSSASKLYGLNGHYRPAAGVTTGHSREGGRS